MGRPTKLSDVQVRERLGNLPGWELEDGKLHRAFRFDLCPRCWRRYLADPLSGIRE